MRAVEGGRAVHLLSPELWSLPGPVAGDEAGHHTADYQGGDTEAQDPAQDSGLGEGLHHSLCRWLPWLTVQWTTLSR